MSDEFGRYARREYERRWLLKMLPAEIDPALPVSYISDHYIIGTRFRLRSWKELATGEVVFKLTQKFPEESGAHDRAVITNTYLTRDEFQVFAHLPGRKLEKRRFAIELFGARYAIDSFADALDGLVLAECEYATHDALRDSPPPPFQGVEVTDRIEFTGGGLAGRSFGHIRRLVDSLIAV